MNNKEQLTEVPPINALLESLNVLLWTVNHAEVSGFFTPL